jgi:hypothetical protein
MDIKFWQACEAEDIENLETFDYDPVFIFRWACFYNKPKILSHLIDKLDREDGLGICYAVTKGHLEVIKILLERLAISDSVLEEAIIHADNQIKELLMVYKYQVDRSEYQRLKEMIE